MLMELFEFAIFPKASLAVTLKVNSLPAALDAGMELSSRLETVAEGFTVIDALVALSEPEVAVRVWDPAVLRVTKKVAKPCLKVWLEGLNTAAGSDEERVTEPE
jgi:hypothetical protein